MAYPIYPVEGTPYSNFHDLNLDWILQRVKEAYEAYKNLPDTVDTSVRAYMESDSFLDALRDIIDENFLTDAAEQAIKERLTTINVRDYGALGDGTDQTAQIQDAVDAFIADPLKSTIYFPAGEYSFQVTINNLNRELNIIGDHSGLTPIRANPPGEDAFRSLFQIVGGYVKISGFRLHGYQPTATPTVGADNRLYRGWGAIIVQAAEELEVSHLHVYDFYIKWLAPYESDQESVDRPALVLKTKNCKSVEMHHCSLTGDVGGEEIIYLANDFTTRKFGQGIYKVHDCEFTDRTIEDGPYSSAVTIRGGNIEFYNNVVKDWRYTWISKGNVIRGSFANLFGAVVNVHDNSFYNCRTAGIDTSEGARYFNTQVMFTNNTFLGDTEYVYRPLTLSAYNAIIEGNTIAGGQLIHIYCPGPDNNPELYYDPNRFSALPTLTGGLHIQNNVFSRVVNTDTETDNINASYGHMIYWQGVTGHGAPIRPRIYISGNSITSATNPSRSGATIIGNPIGGNFYPGYLSIDHNTIEAVGQFPASPTNLILVDVSFGTGGSPATQPYLDLASAMTYNWPFRLTHNTISDKRSTNGAVTLAGFRLFAVQVPTGITEEYRPTGKATMGYADNIFELHTAANAVYSTWINTDLGYFSTSLDTNNRVVSIL